jgi:hypothetical protein
MAVPRSSGYGSRWATADSTARQSFQRDGLCIIATLPQAASQIEEALAPTLAAHHEARQDAMDQRSPEGLIATPHLACDDCVHFRIKEI